MTKEKEQSQEEKSDEHDKDDGLLFCDNEDTSLNRNHQWDSFA